MGHESTHNKDKTEFLPPNFVYSTEDKFYYGPATCEFLHYRTAAVLGAVIEFALQGGSTLLFYYLYHHLESLEYFVFFFMAAFFTISTLLSLFMFYGIFSENAALLMPKIVLQQIQIAGLMAFASFAVIAMSIGLEATNYVSAFVVNVKLMEQDFGPIWPFNIIILAFMAAALCVWIRILSVGAYDYLLDKEFFSHPSRMNVPLEEKNRDD